MDKTYLATVDLGSNSFRLLIGKVVNNQFHTTFSFKENVQLAYGLDNKNLLGQESINRAELALKKINQQIKFLPKKNVKVLATSTFRVAKNISKYLKKFEKTLGFPIEIISGEEEARLIFKGINSSLTRNSDENILAIDIGGGSTEIILGNKRKIINLTSILMGCVTHTKKYFSDKNFNLDQFNFAVKKTENHIQDITVKFKKEVWIDAFGSSGTINAIFDLSVELGGSPEHINKDSLNSVKNYLLKPKSNLFVSGKVKQSRVNVLKGGLVILTALFKQFKIKKLFVADGAMREGILLEMYGEKKIRDIKENSILSLVKRFSLDKTEQKKLKKIVLKFAADCYLNNSQRQFILWASQIYNIGLSLSRVDYQKHSAYIINNSEMPGFSKIERNFLGKLVYSQKGSLTEIISKFVSKDFPLIVCFRLALILNITNNPKKKLNFNIHQINKKKYHLDISREWLHENPLTFDELIKESKRLKKVSILLSINEI